MTGASPEDDGADVASDHDHAAVRLFGHISLHGYQDTADIGEDGDPGCGATGINGSNHIADVLTINSHAGVVDGHFRLLREAGDGIVVPVVKVGSQGEQADGAVEEAGVDECPSERLGDAAPDGGLAGRDGAIECDGASMCHSTLRGVRYYGQQ